MPAAGPARWFFDLWSTFYDLAPVQRLTYRPVHDAVLRVLAAAPPRRLLDVGCGTGLLGARLRDALPETRVVCCDFSLGMLRHAASHAGALGFVQGDALRLPFAAASFDALVCTEAFHWFPDQPAALAEFHRVLAAGGRLVVAVVNPPLEALSEVVRRGSRLVGQPFLWPTRERMRAQVEAAGFRIEAQRRVFRVPAGLLLPPVMTVAVRPGVTPP
jgi:ubiquinone/menaquinone biosynthesis C-methylase UbiE